MPSPIEVRTIAEMETTGQLAVLKALSDADLVWLKHQAVSLKEFAESGRTTLTKAHAEQLVQAYIELFELARTEQDRRKRECVEKTWEHIHGGKKWVEPVRTGYPPEPTDWLKLIAEAKRTSDESLVNRSGSGI